LSDVGGTERPTLSDVRVPKDRRYVMSGMYRTNIKFFTLFTKMPPVIFDVGFPLSKY